MQGWEAAYSSKCGFLCYFSFPSTRTYRALHGTASLQHRAHNWVSCVKEQREETSLAELEVEGHGDISGAARLLLCKRRGIRGQIQGWFNQQNITAAAGDLAPKPFTKMHTLLHLSPVPYAPSPTNCPSGNHYRRSTALVFPIISLAFCPSSVFSSPSLSILVSPTPGVSSRWLTGQIWPIA